MIYRQLGQTDIKVSAICLGSMTWGEQNTEDEAHQQMDVAVEQGINFFDTAEMYPVPPMANTSGLTEQFMGSWFAKRQNREKIILATKIAGRADWLDYIRDGNICFDRNNIESALNDSLKRLQTDYIDLYQLHWPDRNTNYFGKLGYEPDPNEQCIAIEETLSVLNDVVATGKVRYIGVSNETPWGVMRFLDLARQQIGPKIVSIQNPYNLLNRSYEIGLAEISQRENVGLLAYSPLGFGVLSGKYLNGLKPAGARMTLFERFSRYNSDNSVKATAEYVDIAHKHHIDPAQMALAYVNSRPFLTSNIIGATNIKQLKSNISSIDLTLSDEVLAEIESVHLRIPNPSP